MAQAFRPPSAQRVYDVCVIGSQLGGAVAGALLAKRGYRVLHVDHDGLGGGYEDGGYFLPWGPALIPAPRAFPAGEAALSELGLATDLGRLLEPCTPDLQILMPRHRLDVPREPAARAAELAREWPGDAGKLEGGVQELTKRCEGAAPFFKALPPLPPAGFSEKRAVGKAEKGTFGLRSDGAFGALGQHPFVRALQAANRFMSYLDGEPPPLSMARLVGAALRGVYRLPGGYEGLRDVILQKIAESRGEIMGRSRLAGGGSDSAGAPAIAEALEFDGKNIASVRLAGSPNAFVARVFIAATDSAALRRLIPPAHADAKLSALLDQVQARYQLFTVNLVVKEAALPAGLGESALLLRDPEGPLAMENAVLLQVLPARREAKKGHETVGGERTLCLAGFVPTSTRDMGEGHLAEIAARLKSSLADAVPFYERHLVKESIPMLAAAERPRGSRMLPHPLYEVALSRTLGVTGLPPRTPYKNLVLAGREVLPGLGIEGEFHAGVQAADLVGKLLHRRDPLK